MSFLLIKDLVDCVELFDAEFGGEKNLSSFSIWLQQHISTHQAPAIEPDWEGKESGRSVESVINTALVHLFRYAKIYSKLAVADSPFTTIDEVIFLLNLLHRGSMSKTALIELNIHEKSTGIQIINRLLDKGFIAENINENDKRSRTIGITRAGEAALHSNMDKVRQATKLVTADLTLSEKMQLVVLLQKLEYFHQEKHKEGISLE